MSDLHDTSPSEGARRVAGWLLWLLLGIAIVTAVIGLFLLGPLGLLIGIPVAIVLFLAFGASSGGPAGGA